MRLLPRVGYFGLIFLLTGGLQPWALGADDSPAAPSGILDRSNLLGDPSGWRTQLDDAGWSPFATWYGEIWDNAGGGVRTGLTDDMLLTFGTEADLEKLTDWKGGALRVSVNYVQGTRPNHNTGAYSSPTYLDASDQLRVYNLYLRQKLWDDQVTIKIGQLGFDDDFCQPPCLGPYLNAGITAPPAMYGQTLASGDASLPQYPLDSPGIFLRYQPRNQPVYSMTGIYLSDPGPDVSNNHGFDWRASNSVAVLHEVGWNFQIAQRAGTLALGGFYNDGQFTNWDTGAPERGIWGGYAFLNQTLWEKAAVEGKDPESSLAMFAYGGMAGPDARVGPACDFACGLNWAGPLPGRPHDTAGLAVLYTGFSPHYTRSALNPNGAGVSTAAETTVELTYQMAVTPWFTFQPDLQVIFNPANAGTRSMAVVVGARAAVSF